jgi:hypothetical protein
MFGTQLLQDTAVEKELKRNNKIEMDLIMEGLLDLVKFKVGKCSSTRELWDKLQNFYSKEYSLEHVDHDFELVWEERSSSSETYS